MFYKINEYAAVSAAVQLRGESELLKMLCKSTSVNLEIFESKNDLNNIEIPCMLIQPIVENAILHGLEPKKEEDKQLKINIDIQDKIQISIEDNGVGRPLKQKNKSEESDNDDPHAMGLMKTRINLRNESKRHKISMKTIDLTANNTPCGTQIIFEFPLVRKSKK